LTVDCSDVFFSANGTQAPNIPENTMDNDYATRWSAEGDGVWIQYEFGCEKLLKAVQIAFMNGDQRTSTFDVSVSVDGVNYTDLLTGQESSGTSTNLETFAVTPTTAKYVKITGHGNSISAWNSYLEVDFQTDTITDLEDNTIVSGDVLVYPNPFESMINIKNCEGVYFEIVDMTGSIVLNGQVQDKLNLSVLKSGVYFLNLATVNEPKIFKLIKK
jgi:hypothetical protein